MLDLIDKKFTKVLDVHFRLTCIDDRHGAVQYHAVPHVHILHGANHVGKLPNTGRLDENALRMIGRKHFL